MSMRIPPIHCLQTFDTLARVRSVTRTAGELCVTPSAVTNRIKILEDAVGVPLFRRCDFSLTAEGVEDLRDVRDALTVLRRRFVR